MSGFKKFIYFFEYVLLRVVGRGFNLLPFSFALQLAHPAGILLFWLLKRNRERALENLRCAYGAQKSESEIKKIAQASFVHLAEFAVEWLWIPQLAKEPGRYFAIRGVEKLHSSLQKKRGALLLVSHNGNWEIMALIVGLLIAKPVEASIYALARPLKNPYLYREILRRRGLTGLKSIQKEGGVRETFRRLKENGIVSLLIDQRVREGGVKTEFFGRKALTTSLPAIAALRLGTPIFFLFLRRSPDLRYVMEIEGPVSIELGGDREEEIRVNTQRFSDRFEKEIRKDPGRWLWMHNRWRLEEGPKA